MRNRFALLGVAALALVAAIFALTPAQLDAQAVVQPSVVNREDAAHTSTDGGTMALTVRTDTQATSAGTTGDYAALATDARGALYVNPAGHGGVESEVITVTTAGTSVVGTTLTVKECYFSLPTGNTGQCFLGEATGDNRQKGLVLTKTLNPVGPIRVANLNLIWFDCATSGDKVAYFCTK